MSLSLLVGTLAFTSPFIRSSRHDVSFCNAKDNNIRRCCVQTQSNETTESSYVPTTTSSSTSFTSPTYKVYIEDTDSYGVMYNGNYLRAYERALSNLFRSSGSSSNGTSYDRHRWIITHVTNQKFRSSPALGEEFIIRGDLIVDKDGDNDDTAQQTWRLQMVTKNNKSEEDHDEDDDWIVHNSAQLTLSRPTSSVAGIILSYSSTSTSSKKMRVEEIHRAYYDELDSHYSPESDSYEYHVPLRSAMNYFERSRTNVLGGPDKLARMQNEDDILWVVTSVDNGELMFNSIVVVVGEEETDLNINEGDIILSDDWDLTPGRDVIVDTDIVIKRRGMIVEFHHRLLMDVKLNNSGEKNSRRRLLAQATITIMAIKGSTYRPTSKLPKWLLDQLGEND
jgi:acyl-CoA thioesterase FadM